MANKKMKIMTINVPVIFLEAFEEIKTHYPSRSEMMRVALREFLIKELALNTTLTGKDHSDFIRIVKETPTENILKHQHEPMGNKYYLEGMNINEELRLE